MEPILSFSLAMESPFQVDERMTVYDDGRAWLWTLGAAALERRDAAGTWITELPSPVRERVQCLAAEVETANTPPEASPASRRL